MVREINAAPMWLIYKVGRIALSLLWVSAKNKAKSFQVQGKAKRTKTSKVQVLYYSQPNAWRKKRKYINKKLKSSLVLLIYLLDALTTGTAGLFITIFVLAILNSPFFWASIISADFNILGVTLAFHFA